MSGRYQEGRSGSASNGRGQGRGLRRGRRDPSQGERADRDRVGFTGELDEIRLFDLTRSPVTYFEGGLSPSTSLPTPSGRRRRRSPRAARRLPARAPRPTSLRWRLARWTKRNARRSRARATASTSPTPRRSGKTTAGRRRHRSGSSPRALSASWRSSARRVRGADTGEIDPAVLAGDLAGSFFLAPVALVRDLSNATDRAIRGQETGDDALALALGLVQVAGTLTNGKLGAVLKASSLIKGLPREQPRGEGRRPADRARNEASGGCGRRLARPQADRGRPALQPASQLVGVVLDICGVHVPAIEAFNNILTNPIEGELD